MDKNNSTTSFLLQNTEPVAPHGVPNDENFLYYPHKNTVLQYSDEPEQRGTHPALQQENPPLARHTASLFSFFVPPTTAYEIWWNSQGKCYRFVFNFHFSFEQDKPSQEEGFSCTQPPRDTFCVLLHPKTKSCNRSGAISNNDSLSPKNCFPASKTPSM